jgi:phosphodiesterase/alkaline phosphatase D-like protein
MTTFVVSCQGLENYGAHCESGRFADGNQYWKFKSGTDYLVHGLDRPQDAMAFVAAIAMENGIGWKEFPTEVETLEEYRTKFDRDHLDFKLSIMKSVSPTDYIKEAA